MIQTANVILARNGTCQPWIQQIVGLRVPRFFVPTLAPAAAYSYNQAE